MRVTDEVASHLSELATIAGVSKTQWVVLSIEGEYDKLQGNPKLKSLLDDMKTINDKIKAFSGMSEDELKQSFGVLPADPRGM